MLLTWDTVLSPSQRLVKGRRGQSPQLTGSIVEAETRSEASLPLLQGQRGAGGDGFLGRGGDKWNECSG